MSNQREAILSGVRSMLADDMCQHTVRSGINVLLSLCYSTSEANGFWDHPPNFGEKIALIHSELSEALEANRKGEKDSHLPQFSGEVVELADALIRIFDLAHGLRLPLVEALIAKMEYNISRPYKHGKAF